MRKTDSFWTRDPRPEAPAALWGHGDGPQDDSFLGRPRSPLEPFLGAPPSPADCGEPLHCRPAGAMMSSSMSSMSSDMRKCWGVARPPMKLGSRLRAEASEGRPGLFTTVKPVSSSICCQRCSLSLRAAVTSPRACLERGDGREERGGGEKRGYPRREEQGRGREKEEGSGERGRERERGRETGRETERAKEREWRETGGQRGGERQREEGGERGVAKREERERKRGVD